MDADRTFKSPARRRRFIRVLLLAQKRSASAPSLFLCSFALFIFTSPPLPPPSCPALCLLFSRCLRHGDYHQAMGFVISFLMLFLDDNDILKIVCVACAFPPNSIDALMSSDTLSTTSPSAPLSSPTENHL